jgi:DNA polymerase III subunit delta
MPSEITFDAIIRDVKAKKFKPVYVLMGEEDYYIDQIQKAIMDNALPTEDRDFCLTTFYGGETTANEVINAARSFPMGERLLVVLRDAGSLRDIEEMSVYLANPQPTTILLLVNKGGTFDRRKKFMAAAAKLGVVYSTPKIYDSHLPAIISKFFRDKGLSIEPKAVSVIADSIGVDIAKLYQEMNKLADIVGADGPTITPAIVEQHIGISKDFNVVEFTDALVLKNSFKAFQIAKYFNDNPKQYPLPKILPLLFRTFSQLMSAYYAPAKDKKSLADYLGLHPFVVEKSVIPALRNYSASKVLSVLLAIRDADERSKGIGGVNVSEGDLLRDLIFFILH